MGWEIVEPKLKRSKTWRKRFPDPTDDTLINSVTDVLDIDGLTYFVFWFIAALLTTTRAHLQPRTSA